MGKICPLMSRSPNGSVIDCQKENCAWYMPNETISDDCDYVNSEFGACSIKVIANHAGIIGAAAHYFQEQDEILAEREELSKERGY